MTLYQNIFLSLSSFGDSLGMSWPHWEHWTCPTHTGLPQNVVPRVYDFPLASLFNAYLTYFIYLTYFDVKHLLNI